MGSATTPHPSPQLITVIYFKSQRIVNNIDVTQITICCHVDYYMIEIYHNGFKLMYMQMSTFLFPGLLQFAVNKFFCVLLIFQ